MRRLAWECFALAMWLALVAAIAAHVSGWVPEAAMCAPELIILEGVEGNRK